VRPFFHYLYTHTHTHTQKQDWVAFQVPRQRCQAEGSNLGHRAFIISLWGFFAVPILDTTWADEPSYPVIDYPSAELWVPFSPYWFGFFEPPFVQIRGD